MKKHNTLWLLLLALCSIFAGCKKDNANAETQQDILPPATQTGANTFGCFVNGKVWIPKGHEPNGIKPNPHIQYDYDLSGKPYLFIDTKQYIDNTLKGGFYIVFRNLENVGEYKIPDKFRFSIGWENVLGNCGMTTLDSTVQSWGGGVITKLDIPNQIIAGTFAFKAKRTGCDTVYITDGRFDIKF